MKKYIFITLLFSMPGYLHAQGNYCSEILKQANTALRKDSIEKALQKLQDVEICDYRNELRTERQQLQSDIFAAIKKQKDDAKQAEKKAKNAGAEAEKAKIAVIEQGKIVLVNQLTAQAEVIRNNIPAQIEKSVLLALKSMQINYTPEAEEVLRKGLALLPRTVKRFSKNESDRNMFVSVGNKCIVTINSDDTVVVRDIETGEKIFGPRYMDGVNFVALDSQSKYLAANNSDNIVVLWELKSGKEIYSFKDQAEIIEKEPDRILNRDDSVSEVTSRVAYTTRLAFSPNGRYLVIASGDSTVRLIDIPLLKIKFILESNSLVNDIKFSPDGKFLASKTDSIIIMWEVETGNKKFQIDSLNGKLDFEFDPKGRFLATAGEGEITTLWDAQTGQAVAKVGEFAHEAGYLVDFGPGGNFLWTTTRNGTVTKWDINTKQEVYRIQNNAGSGKLLSISSDGVYIATAGFGNLANVWRATDGSEVARFAHEGLVSSVTFLDSSRYLATASEVDGIKIWEIQSVNPVASFYNSLNSLLKMSFSDDEKFLLTNGSSPRDIFGSEANVWDIPGNVRKLHKVNSRGNRIDAIISNDGKFLFLTSRDSVWKQDLKTGNIVTKIKLEGTNIRSAGLKDFASFSPNGRYLIKKINQKTLLWKIDSGSHAMRLELSGLIHAASFSPGGSLLITVSLQESAEKDSVEIFELESSQRVKGWSYPKKIPFFAISYDDKYIAVPASDTAIVMNLKDKKEFIRILFPKDLTRERSNELKSLAFSPDGEYLIGGQANGKTSVFNILNGNEVARVDNPSWINQVLFSPRQNYVATAGNNGLVRLWLWRPDDLIAAACSLLTRNFTFEEWKMHFGEVPYELVCRNLPPHPSLLKEGERRARSGDINGAVTIIKLAVSLGDTLKTEPKKWALQLAASEKAKGLVDRGLELIDQGAIKEAVAAFSKAQQLDPMIEISATDWNELAWQGAIRNHANEVIEAIKNALKLEPDNGHYRDTRGLIRALTGDYKGAIEDFEFFVKQQSDNKLQDDNILKRQKWIGELKAGRNPFDSNTLKELINE